MRMYRSAAEIIPYDACGGLTPDAQDPQYYEGYYYQSGTHRRLLS